MLVSRPVVGSSMSSTSGWWPVRGRCGGVAARRRRGRVHRRRSRSPDQGGSGPVQWRAGPDVVLACGGVGETDVAGHRSGEQVVICQHGSDHTQAVGRRRRFPRRRRAAWSSRCRMRRSRSTVWPLATANSIRGRSCRRVGQPVAGHGQAAAVAWLPGRSVVQPGPRGVVTDVEAFGRLAGEGPRFDGGDEALGVPPVRRR